MIEVLKRRYKVGDIITLHTTEASFTGKLDAFEDTCVILITEDGEEFILNEDIKRISIPKKEDTNTSEISTINEPPKSEVPKLEVPKVEVEIQPIEVKLPPPEYTAGDKIPLEILDKRMNKKKAPKTTHTFGSLSELSTLILPELEAENKKVVPANGVITNFYVGYSIYGFIADGKGNKIWFSPAGIIDSELLETIGNKSSNLNIPVLFNITESMQGKKAINIQKPKPIEQIAKIASQYFERKDFKTALSVLDQIFISFPDNYTAKKIKEDIETKRPNSKFHQNKLTYKSDNLNYQKAKKLDNIHKNREEALNYYLLALENNEKRESCIKDIAMLYVSMGELQKALDFTKKYEDELEDTIPNNNHLYNFYRSLAAKGTDVYDDLLKITNLVIEDTSRTNKARYTELLSSKAFALIQLGELDEAREVLEEAVSIQPENTYATRLLDALEEAKQSGNFAEFNKLVAATDVLNFYGGLSGFIQGVLDGCEYIGLKESVKLKGVFSIEHLNELRDESKKLTEGKPRERADYLLTEAKLIQELQLDKNEELRSTMARYCNAMGISSIYDYLPVDVVRFYYFEAFILESKWDSIIRQFVIYINSFTKDFSELRRITAREKRDLFVELFPRSISNLQFVNKTVFNELMTLFIYNTTIFDKVSQGIYENQKIRNLFLGHFKIETENIKNYDSFNKVLIELREKRQQDIYKWFATIKSISNNENIESVTNVLFHSLELAKVTWLPQLDTFRLNTILSDILNILNQYLRQSGYRDKERYYGFAKAQVYQLISEIKDKPTKFSYEGFIPLLEKIELLLDKSFKTIEAASTPKVKISILGEASIVTNDNIVPFQVKIENSKDSSPIRDIKLIVQSGEGVSFTPINNEYFDSVDGGENCIIKLSVKLSKRIVKDKATSLSIQYFYKKRNQEEPIVGQESLSLRLYSEEEFEIIPNPYEKLANGGPVTDISMFYGRNEFIERITDAIITADSKQVVIFGQKRSGKSSVLYHLKKSLENTQKTFCVSFSIGDIFETISTATFFYKILSVIEEELENLTFEGKAVPEFKCPTFKDFNENPNPADLFRKHLRSFKRACSVHPEWNYKKLVVMIDEFTYLFTAIKTNKVSDAIMKQWKAITQNEDATFSSVLVGQDVFPMFKDEFPNEFGITQDERLTYLSKPDAIKLIEIPVWNQKTNRNRFIGDAIDTIMDYTSCNPYYIQIFCARLVTEMNRRKYIEVTNADIKEVADSFINGGQALTDDKFDNLLNAGEKYDIQKIPQEHSKSILKQIANNAMNVGFCLREQISIGKPDYEDEILRDLVKREVLEQKGDSYKIQVKLFQEWLLKH